jgi:hypothetical protein
VRAALAALGDACGAVVPEADACGAADPEGGA